MLPDNILEWISVDHSKSNKNKYRQGLWDITVPHDKSAGMVIIPCGVSDSIDVFLNFCMPIAFVVGQRICLAAKKGPKEIKKELSTLRVLCQRQRTSKKIQYQLGPSNQKLAHLKGLT